MSSFQDRENDELYISMVDDDTKRKVEIPTGFLLGKNGYVHKFPNINYPYQIPDK